VIIFAPMGLIRSCVESAGGCWIRWRSRCGYRARRFALTQAGPEHEALTVPGAT
jgi:hypothetical protein